MSAAGPSEVPGVDHTPRTVVLELTPELESAATQATAVVGESEPPAGPGDATHGSSPLVTPGNTSAVPEGKGPLYKCAICADFVYESQLEYHVTICPDPNDSSSLLSTPGAEQAVAAAEPDVAQETFDSYRDEVLRESLAVSEASQKMWAQWSKDSKLAEHHNVMVQRSSQKRNQLLDELRKKEAEECTFQPKTLSRGSPRTFSRPDTTGEVKWEQRLDQRKRDQRLKQVEAQHYAELTLKPKISPFAQAWSQKQAEAVRESQSANSVFERLYQAALQQEEKQTAAKREREDQAECLSPPAAISNRNSPPRRIPTSELLYSDALDRRERLRIMTEQMQLRRDEETKERCAVLYKSSRLYYQLIEKQIKAAFDGAANGQPQLAQASLEDFLVRFKCMRPRKKGEVPAEDLESARLQAALWRHLDPNKVGHTDLKTVTLFFHVLMGAVDDAAQNAASAMEEPGASPAKSTQSEGGSIALQSINEEGYAEGDSILAALSKNAGMQEEEDRRLVELLLRFDPLRLRTEFQPLLLHRMHYQGMAAQTEQERSPRKEKKEGPVVVSPVIDAQSRSMAEKLLEKQRSESGKDTHPELLLWRHKQVQARKESLRKQRTKEEAKGCTFRPKCNPAKTKEGHVEILTPAGSTRAEVLYARGLADKERRKAKVLESEKARSTAEARGCTFRPNVSKSVKSYHKTTQKATQVPRGFYETRQRIRAAYEIREKVLQQQEDRMAKIEQTVPYQVSGAPAAPLVGKTPQASAGSSPGLSPVPESPTKLIAPVRQRSAGVVSAAGPRTSFFPPSRGSGLDADAPQEGIQTEEEGVEEEQGPAVENAGNAEGNASPDEPAQDVKPDTSPMLYVDVNIAHGQPAERIVLYQGQNVSEVAAEFAAKHVLTPALAQKLHSLLREVVLKQELQNQAR